jgi:restriction system protein
VSGTAAKAETSAPEVEQNVADEFGLTPDERGQLLPSGRQRILHNRIHWAKFYMAKAGLLDSPKRGRFIASANGRALLASNPDRIDVQRLLAYPSFQEFYKSGQSTEAHPVESR